MKLAIFGAGAIGSYVGGRLARAGEDVTLIARGATLDALRARGLRVRESGEEWTVHPPATNDLSVLRQMDAVFLTVKTHALPAVAPALAAALGPETAVVTAQNGMPWWYFQRHGGPLEGTRLRTLDPDGVLERSFPVERVIGCVLWLATHVREPGRVEHTEGRRLSLGEPDGTLSERCLALSAALGRAGLEAPVLPHLRQDLWVKLLGNCSFNPMSGLTGATLREIAEFPEAREAMRGVMEEASAVARALGITLPVTVEQRLEIARRVGAHKPSMRHDVEAGRPTEIEALTGAVVELADLLGVSVPQLRTLYACAKLLDRMEQEHSSSSRKAT